MEQFNCVETTAILVCKQISSNSFKNEITNNLLYIMYISLNICKQMTNVKSLLLHLAVQHTVEDCEDCKDSGRMSSGSFRNIINKMFTNHVFMYSRFGIK